MPSRFWEDEEVPRSIAFVGFRSRGVGVVEGDRFHHFGVSRASAAFSTAAMTRGLGLRRALLQAAYEQDTYRDEKALSMFVSYSKLSPLKRKPR